MNDPGLYEWMALRRIADGGITKSAGAYLDHGRPVPGHLAPVFDRLVWSGFLNVADGDPLWELRRISLTEAGQIRYEALCQQQRQRTKLEVPPPEFGTTSTQTPISRVLRDCPHEVEEAGVWSDWRVS